ncbi:MAG TPA: TonB-dependent receptor [Clostridia bacterium]|nr:TonB-dependent receptor [Clostridia bacterium]
MRYCRCKFLYGTALLVLMSVLVFAQNVGVVQGTVADPTGAVIPNARVTLTSALSGYKQVVSTDNNGFYKFANIPYSQFTVHAEASGFQHGDQSGELRSNVPLIVNLKLQLATSQQEVTVTEQAPLLETTSSGTHHDLDYAELGKLPQSTPGRGMSSVVQSVPGVVQDDNGRMHARGSESQVQYVVDGVPITEQLSAVFSTGLSVQNMRTTEVMTGNIPAEYGDKLGAVVNVNTRSGLEMPWTGSVSLSSGSSSMSDVGGEFGGHVGKLGVFVSGGTSRSRRYLDPPEIGNYNNVGGNARLFTRFDWAPSEKDSLRLSLSTNGSDFRVPNRFEQQIMGQRLRQELRDDSESLGWNHVFGSATVLDAVVYRRSSSARLLDPQATGFPFSAEQSRRQRNEGARANLSHEWKNNSFKVGFEAKRLPISEFFTVAATDRLILADPSNPASAFPLSRPFVFTGAKTGNQSAFYLQDHLRVFDRLTVDLGLRYDHYDIITREDAWSPRVGLAYFVKQTGTVVRASYNRLFQTPPTENLLLSSSQAGQMFSPVASGTTHAVPPEWQNFYEFGVQQQFGRFLRFDVSRYMKNIKNFSDKDQFLETGVIFPIAIARGDVRGTEVRLDLAEVHGFSGFMSYANSKSNGTTPIVGGLFLGEASSELLVPGIQFPNDHDERNEGQFGVTYSHKSGAWGSFTGRYDSGVPTDFNPATFNSLDPRLQEQLDPVRLRVKPRSVFELALGYDMMRERRFPVSLQLTVNNMFDRFYLFNFESVFSGTHIGRPREVAVRMIFHWSKTGKKGAGAID